MDIYIHEFSELKTLKILVKLRNEIVINLYSSKLVLFVTYLH